MKEEETSLFAHFPWMPPAMGAFPAFIASSFQPASSMAAFQRAWVEGMAAAFKGFQTMAIQASQLAQGAAQQAEVEAKKAGSDIAVQPPAFAAGQEVLKSVQDLGTTMLSANMKALDAMYGRFTGVWGEMAATTHERAADRNAISAASTAQTYESAARESWQSIEKAQETSAKAWNMLQKRLAEGVKEWNAAAGNWAPGADMPKAIKESYERFATDSSGLYEVVQKTNAEALSLMQKRFSAAVDEMTAHFPAMTPGKSAEKLEVAAQAYERTASAISDALMRANRETLEALQAWTVESMKAGPSGGQRAA